MSVYEGEIPFNCDICDSSFAQRAKLKQHKGSVHEGKKLSNVLYSICESTFAEKAIAFATKDSIQNGYWIDICISSIHEGKKSCKCEHCKATFLSKNTHIVSSWWKEAIWHYLRRGENSKDSSILSSWGE